MNHNWIPIKSGLFANRVEYATRRGWVQPHELRVGLETHRFSSAHECDTAIEPYPACSPLSAQRARLSPLVQDLSQVRLATGLVGVALRAIPSHLA